MNKKKNNLLSKLEKNKNYQLEYASHRPMLYDDHARRIKAVRMIKLFEQFFSAKQMKTLTVLDIGSSTGIIDVELARHFKRVICIDIDRGAIEFAKKTFKRKNLEFKLVDFMNSGIRNNSFDIIICTHTYEHVPDQKKLFAEMYRILKSGGMCYLAATNRLQIIEPHYNLPFLSLIPKFIAHGYVKLFKKADRFYETPRTYWTLKNFSKKFKVVEFTDKILRNPKLFGYEDSRWGRSALRYITWIISPVSKYLSPTFIWILVKKQEKNN